MKKKTWFNPSLVIFIIALLIRLGFSIIGYSNEVWIGFADDAAYSSMADSVLEQGPLLLDNDALHPTAKIVGPGIAWIIATVRSILGQNWLYVFLLNSIISSLMCVVIYRMAIISSVKIAAYLASFWAVVYPFYLMAIPTSGKEVWIQFLFVIALLYFIRYIKEDRFLPLVMSSISLTLLVHIDERYLAYLPVIVFFILFSGSSSIKRKVLASLVYLTIIVALLVPWTIRNYAVYDKLVIVSIRTAPLTDRFFSAKNSDMAFKPNPHYWALSDAQIDSVLLGKIVHNKRGPIDQDHAEAIRRGLMPRQFKQYEIWLSSLRELWEPIDIWDNYKQFGHRWDGKWSTKHNLLSGLSFGILLPLAIIGLMNLFHRNKMMFWIFITVLIYHSVIHMLFIPYTLYRYRIPIDFIVIICAFIEVGDLLQKIPWLRRLNEKLC